MFKWLKQILCRHDTTGLFMKPNDPRWKDKCAVTYWTDYYCVKCGKFGVEK